jgi:anti-sigma B factor antagonist
MESNFAVHTHTTGRTVRLALSGELDIVSTPVLEKTMAELSASDAELVVVDLRGLQFMDSTGLHLLIQAQQQAHDLGRRFALVRGPDQVQRLFDLTGLTETLTIVGSPDELLEVEPAPGAREPL